MLKNAEGALEKSYGIDIPMPKCMVKKVNNQKAKFSVAKKCSKIDCLKQLKHSKKGNKHDDETLQAMAKIQRT